MITDMSAVRVKDVEKRYLIGGDVLPHLHRLIGDRAREVDLLGIIFS